MIILESHFRITVQGPVPRSPFSLNSKSMYSLNNQNNISQSEKTMYALLHIYCLKFMFGFSQDGWGRGGGGRGIILI